MTEGEPKTFAECMQEANTRGRLNATVRKLGSVPDEPSLGERVSEEMKAQVNAVYAVDAYKEKIAGIASLLSEKLNAHKFRLLLKSVTQSSMALALYAGNGIIVKITENSHYEKDIRPYGLPPIRIYETDGVTVGIYPWVNTANITETDVEEMIGLLKANNLRFKLSDNMKSGDARTDNIGRLPDGTLIVLDGNAVESIDKEKGIDPDRLDSWLKRINKNFGALYSQKQEADISKLISGEPDFEMRFSPYIKSQTSSSDERGGSHASKIGGKERGRGWWPFS